jgi:putative SOS response-associated peptidase YedK
MDPKKFRLDTINAKGETLTSSSMWRESFLYRRCLLPVDIFIEWQRIDSKTKLPWMFAIEGRQAIRSRRRVASLGVAGSQVTNDTFAIITTEPNELLVEKTGHDRMPVIIKPADYQRWLEPGPVEHPPIDLIRPFDSEKMKAWRVDRRINNVKIYEPSLREPVKEEKPPAKPKPAEKRKVKSDENDQLSMF